MSHVNKRRRLEDTPPEKTVKGRLTKASSVVLGDKHGHQVPTLLSVCVNFVAVHMDLVDSFHGLPEIIGKEIYQGAENHNAFSPCNNPSLHALSIFTDAYCDAVLSSLDLSGQCLVIDNYYEHLCLFQSLTHLKLDHCHLGSDHELLKHTFQIQSLVSLSLCDNALTDIGLQKLTLPMRHAGRGPLEIQHLNLSDNARLSCKCLKYFTPLKKLQTLDVTGTSIQKSQVSMVEKMLCFELLKGAPKADHSLSIKTSGWAEKLIDKWHKASEHIPKYSSTATAKFYKKKKPQIQMDPLSITQYSNEKPCLIFVQKENKTLKEMNIKPNRNASETIISKQHSIKNKIDKENTSKYSVSHLQESVDLTDNDLLQMYSGNFVTQKNLSFLDSLK